MINYKLLKKSIKTTKRGLEFTDVMNPTFCMVTPYWSRTKFLKFMAHLINTDTTLSHYLK